MFPGGECQYVAYGDGQGEGYSRFDTAKVSESGALLFSAYLGTEAKYPFSGIKISHKKSTWNVSSYDSVVIVLDSGSSSCNVTLTTYEPGVSRGREPNRDRYNQMDFHTNKKRGRFASHLRSMPTPAWWFTMNKVKREELPPSDFSKVTAIAFSNHPSARAGDSVHFAIRDIRFVRSKRKPVMVFLIWGAVWFILMLIYVIRQRAGRSIQVVQKEKKFSTRKEKVLHSFEALHVDTGVTISLLAKHAGVSEYHIRTILKDEFSCTFSEYLKIVRIEEAKRLLRESDLDIKEIAHEVGFSHASSFARAFKEIEKVSPSQYRDKES